MRLIKILVIVLILIVSALSALWYYATFTVSNKVNTEYASKPIAVKGFDKKDYYLTFEKLSPDGFPFNIAWSIEGWSEESRDAVITYSSPIKLGYNFLSGQVFVEYSGDIIASYKPESRGFGSKLKINNYKITIDLPLTNKLISSLRNMQDPVEIINYIGDMNISTASTEIFDLVDNEKFYDKEYERLKLSFVPSKYYENTEDILANIPKHYETNYSVKVNSVDALYRNIPVSLFYGFSLLPNGFNADAKMVLDTQGANIDEIAKGLKIKADISSISPLINLPNFKFHYEDGHGASIQDADKLDINSTIHLNKGFFDKIFSYYDQISDELKSSDIGKIVDSEIRYIINNKNYFRFEDIENTDYEFNLKMNSYSSEQKLYIKIDEFSLFSESTGFKIIHEMEAQDKGYKRLADNRWFAKGVLFLKNYQSIVDFTSGYIYRFGEFRFLTDDARNLYVDINKSVLKQISDHPDSHSSDLSFDYSIDSLKLREAKFGTVRFDQIGQIYKLALYEELFTKVGFGDDALEKARKILPNLNLKDPILQKFLPTVSKLKDINADINKKIQKNLEKAVPKDAKKILDKVIPKDVIKHDILKNLIK
ncbi:hypothetical protein OAP56_01280 [Rickettsiaceae bacterium]|nr:hypothetical protein [Rickettsiaceae bacterium]